ncbi:hypothetical protein B0T26DRAFT_716501 [Lasiosphaeria miniovina]|uniref:Carbohydrate-binding module family 19 domain-containing protein n=1 Tax=Lasiosphaeria miniovina TaxID=1954250 RepID=A0AA40DTU7_9PEZI|nr:uncharacterized protein B0T26DRAFT_716501 [Lasiosphaeria miniovina]KAK0713122.1 hypothetical protein B0T26DRAFT_716501 [Lasiosphaeria miniovina]
MASRSTSAPPRQPNNNDFYSLRLWNSIHSAGEMHSADLIFYAWLLTAAEAGPLKNIAWRQFNSNNASTTSVTSSSSSSSSSTVSSSLLSSPQFITVTYVPGNDDLTSSLSSTTSGSLAPLLSSPAQPTYSISLSRTTISLSSSIPSSFLPTTPSISLTPFITTTGARIATSSQSRDDDGSVVFSTISLPATSSAPKTSGTSSSTTTPVTSSSTALTSASHLGSPSTSAGATLQTTLTSAAHTASSSTSAAAERLAGSLASTLQTVTGTPISNVPTVITSLPAPTATVDAAVYAKNLELARQYNNLFANLTRESACREPQAACITGDVAKCGTNGGFVMTPCPSDTSCFALPMNTTDGVELICVDKAAAAFILGMLPSSSPSTSSVPKFTRTVTVTESSGIAKVTYTYDPNPKPPLFTSTSSAPGGLAADPSSSKATLNTVLLTVIPIAASSPAAPILDSPTQTQQPTLGNFVGTLADGQVTITQFVTVTQASKEVITTTATVVA